jgi:hypothetical protein
VDWCFSLEFPIVAVSLALFLLFFRLLLWLLAAIIAFLIEIHHEAFESKRSITTALPDLLIW